MMPKISFLFFSLIASPVMGGHAAEPYAQVVKTEAIQIRLYGLVCSYCASGLKEVLTKEKRVARFEINIKKGNVLIWFKPGIEVPDGQQIQIWIEQSGLKVKSIGSVT